MKRLMDKPYKIICTDKSAEAFDMDAQTIMAENVSRKLAQDIPYNDEEMIIHINNTDMHFIAKFRYSVKEQATYINIVSPFLVTYLHIPLQSS